MTDSIQAIRADIQAAHINAPFKEDLHAADAEVASLYYQSSISSLSYPNNEAKETIQAIEDKEIQRSFLGRAKDWLWEIFGWGQQQPISELEKAVNDPEKPNQPFAGGIPKLPAPEMSDSFIQHINDLNQRLEKIASSSEELEKNHSAELDKLFYLLLVYSSLQQKNLKHLKNQAANEEFFLQNEKHKNLQKLHFELLDAIHEAIKKRGILKWINIGLTFTAVTGMSLAYALSGPFSILSTATSLSFLGKGSTSLTDGIIKFNSDAKTGDLVVVKQEAKSISTKKQEKISEMQNTDEDIAVLLKKIRYYLDIIRKAERSIFGRNP